MGRKIKIERSDILVKYGYERVDVTFSKNSDLEMELYKFVKEQGKLIGNGRYIKQLIQKEMGANK